MKKNKEPKEYQKGKIGLIIRTTLALIRQDPELLKEENELRLATMLKYNLPELKDKSKCGNCGESMAVYMYTLSVLDAQLLCAIAKVVTKRMQGGKTFTEANKVHLQTEIGDYTLASRQTIASKLGLVAKVKNREGKHDRKAGWCITTRGYEFLAGKPVPKKVKVFHNQIQEHFDEMITMSELFRNSNVKSEDWQDIAGVFIAEYEAPRLL